MTPRRRYKPMLAKEASKVFTDKDWIFEVKWDGFRALAYINGELSLRSRNQKELIDNFPELQELKQQPKGMVLDGEIIILNKGKVDFQALLERGKASSPTDIALKTARSPAAYVVFDILEKDGEALLDLPLMERKRILKETVKESERVVLADYVEEKGENYFEAVLQKGLEGVMAKKKNSAYLPGVRSGNWLKIKKLRSCDCVIFGYTKGTGARKSTFGALLLGLYDSAGKPVYVGKVGTGFSEDTLKGLSVEFQKMQTDVAPFKADVLGEVTWLKPKLVCEIGYQVVTKDGRLRMPRLLRLRTDKQPKDCTIDQLGKEPLKEYVAKRDFERTSEPQAVAEKKNSESKIFVVQEHHARRLHYDFRLERDGVLKSWAVPKGIPETPQDKRLAVAVEDHPLDYAKFEGEIPEGQYGAGKVIIWDKGTYETKVWDEKMVEVILDGAKLKGRYVLVPLKRAGEKNWLMLKAKD
jgi:DNA ligase D-like protein (predicted ligase)/DNA ligase D-like protein (predicted 3'-phosphoesterase)